MQSRSGCLRSRSVIWMQTVPLSLPGALRRIAEAPWASASGATKLSAEPPVGVPASVSSTTREPSVERSPVSSSSLKMRTGTVGGVAPGAADDGGGRVVGDRPEVVADGGELVGRAGVVARVRVRDHRVDVGVLEQQRAQAAVLERVAEAPHAVAVDVGDGADRADREVARRVADAHRRAGARRGAGKGVSGIAGAASTVPPRLRARLGELPREPAVEPGDRQRLGQRQHAPDPRAAGVAARDRLAARRVGRVGEDLLDRRREHGLAAVLADRLGDRAGVAPAAVDRRAGEARADAGAVDRRGRTRG